MARLARLSGTPSGAEWTGLFLGRPAGRKSPPAPCFFGFPAGPATLVRPIDSGLPATNLYHTRDSALLRFRLPSESPYPNHSYSFRLLSSPHLILTLSILTTTPPSTPESSAELLTWTRLVLVSTLLRLCSFFHFHVLRQRKAITAKDISSKFSWARVVSESRADFLTLCLPCVSSAIPRRAHPLPHTNSNQTIHTSSVCFCSTHFQLKVVCLCLCQRRGTDFENRPFPHGTDSENSLQSCKDATCVLADSTSDKTALLLDSVRASQPPSPEYSTKTCRPRN